MLRWLATVVVSLGLGPAIADAQTASQPDEVLFRFYGEGLFDGAFGPLRTVEQAAAAALEKCGSKVIMTISGRMDAQAKAAFKALAACPEISPKLGATSEAKDGAVTVDVWRALVPDPVPDAAARARTIMLTFEATDYTALGVGPWRRTGSRG